MRSLWRLALPPSCYPSYSPSLLCMHPTGRLCGNPLSSLRRAIEGDQGSLFAASVRRLTTTRDGRQQNQQQKPKEQQGGAGGGDGSVFKKFAENIKRGTKDEELKASVQKFEQKLTELHENEAFKRAKEILSKAKADALKQNEALVGEVRERADDVRQAVGAVASKVGSTLSSATQPVKELGEKIRPYVPNIGESKVVQKVSKTMSEAEERLLEETNVYQYGGFKNKEQREKSKEKLISPNDGSSSFKTPSVQEDPNAGSAVVMHKQSIWSQKWSDFKDNNRLVQKFFGLKRTYDESNNIFAFFAREITNSISDRFSSIFSESETARAIKEISQREPAFNMERFMKLTREHIIPEILDAFLVADLPSLRLWCSDAMFNVLKANFDAQLKPGCRLEGRILDMRNLDLVTAKLLEDTPVVVFSFNTQQISYMRDAKGVIVEGAEDAIENVLYVMALAKEPLPASGQVDKLTQGWKLIELAIRDKNGSW